MWLRRWLEARIHTVKVLRVLSQVPNLVSNKRANIWVNIAEWQVCVGWERLWALEQICLLTSSENFQDNHLISLRFATSWQEKSHGIVENNGQLWSKFEIHHILYVTLDNDFHWASVYPSIKINCQFTTQSVRKNNKECSHVPKGLLSCP